MRFYYHLMILFPSLTQPDYCCPGNGPEQRSWIKVPDFPGGVPAQKHPEGSGLRGDLPHAPHCHYTLPVSTPSTYHIHFQLT